MDGWDGDVLGKGNKFGVPRIQISETRGQNQRKNPGFYAAFEMVETWWMLGG